ncbi:hypothetical protein J5N97_004106 [Dioscorea zingiberensis]|uniref:Uncharacterized protein n=1 Tax=Dioscorea zingiberensis TaxID=325984 RepID=A0A9D5D800_9LILI|nr:hypothetical protein J5N97_004106 [Dioscorea zingiberensis]
MGIRLPSQRTYGSSSRDGDDETPVLVSVDVMRRKLKLKLDGIIRTVITLGCKRCAEPAAERIFSNFTLLLIEYPIEEARDYVLSMEQTFTKAVVVAIRRMHSRNNMGLSKTLESKCKGDDRNAGCQLMLIQC